MSELGPLHPRRVQEALSILRECVVASQETTRGRMRREFHAALFETEIAALELIAKAQKAAGITGNVADMGAALLNFMRACSK